MRQDRFTEDFMRGTIWFDENGNEISFEEKLRQRAVKRQENPDFSRTSHSTPVWRAPSRTQRTLESMMSQAISAFIKDAKIVNGSVTFPKTKQTALAREIAECLDGADDEGNRIAGMQERGIVSGIKKFLAHAKEIVADIMTQVHAKVQSLIDQNNGLLNPYENIVETIGDWAGKYAEAVAATEITAAVEESILDELTKQGVTMVSWVANPDACKTCLDNMEASPIAIGSEFPSGDQCPPSHPRCRCTIAAAS